MGEGRFIASGKICFNHFVTCDRIRLLKNLTVDSGTHRHSEMPRRPRPAHRAPPGQIQKSNYRAPPLSAKAKIVSKVRSQFREANSKISKITLEEGSSSSEDLKQMSRQTEEDKLETLDTLKRRREDDDEEEDEDEVNDEDEVEVEDVDAETDIDADADAPRIVQWLDDEDDTPELKQKAADEVRLSSRS